MIQVKVILITAAICSALAAVMFIFNDVTIKENIGEFSYKTYTIIFILCSVMLTKEASQILIEKDYE